MDPLRPSPHPSRAPDLHRAEASLRDLSGAGALPQRSLLPEREGATLGTRAGEAGERDDPEEGESEGKSEGEGEGEEGAEEGEEGEEEVIARIVAGARAPDFNVPLVGGGYRGLADLLEPGGGILVFFKEDCAASELVLSRLGPLAKALAREDRFFLAIAEDPEEAIRAFRERHDIVFPIAWQEPPYH